MDITEFQRYIRGPSGCFAPKISMSAPGKEDWASDACSPAADVQSEKKRLLHNAPVAVKVQRRNFFRFMLGWKKHKISPLLGAAPSPGESQVEEVTHMIEQQPPSLWTSLPEHLLEAILRLMKDGKDKDDWAHVQDLFQVSAVCRAWRRASKRVFFSQPWDSCTTLCHPLQLFSTRVPGLPPRLPLLDPPPTGGRENRDPVLLRCFVRREMGVERAVAKFQLYLGSEHNEPDTSKFLMAALLTSRWETVLYFTSDFKQPPAARLQSNIFGTHYEMALDPSVRPFDESWEEGDRKKKNLHRGSRASRNQRESLVEIVYKTRLKGFMRPRRMKVALPPASVMDRFSSADGLAAARAEAAAYAAAAQDSEDSLADADARPQVDADDSDTPRDGATSVIDSPGLGAQEASEPAATVSRPSLWSLSSGFSRNEEWEGREGMQLRNKPPHWNDNLRCWCLNFRGRVKLASVKNFQLILSSDPSKSIVMQFGKVDANTYIMDFNPCIVSTAQAFAIALSTFDTKVLL
ncbi:Tubby-like F-box protein 9 [Coccomyxa sp. Obi]|nr:Tubby-like F-box protein 9 [Coccomyxa sp. Obi]